MCGRIYSRVLVKAQYLGAQISYIKQCILEVGEVGEWFKGLAALADDQSLIPI